EIAKEIVDLLKINLSFDDMKAVVGLPTDNIDSYENYVLGQQENLKKSVTANRKSIDYYGKAIRLDTTFANAYAEIASSTLERIIYNDATPREVIRLAKIYLDKAEELNDQLATIYSCRGLISIYEENYPEALFNYEKAIRMAPNDPDIRLGFARYFNTVNEYEKQIEQNRLAYKLDPLSFDTAQKFAQALLVNKKYKEVEILLEDFRTKFGNKYTNQINRLYIQYAIGTQNFDQAISDLKALAWKDSLQLGALGYSYGRKNDTVMAKTVIDSIKILEDFPMKNYEIATVFAGLGNRDSVLYYLDSTRINPTILISKDMDYPQILTDVNIFNKLILNYYK
ncbi:tetratricopeptide repeat protein, partial [Aegicerativicinus sediminis]